MRNVRFEFQKTGRAVYISHLDLMTSLARAMTRAKIPAWRTEGFNPHPFISLALALSLGYTGAAELAEISITDDGFDIKKIPEMINGNLPDGIYINRAWERVRPAKQIKYASYTVVIDTANAAEKTRELFSRDKIVLQKRSKSGISDTDIIPYIKKLDISDKSEGLVLEAILSCASDASLNPEYIVRAIENDINAILCAHITRNGFFDGEMQPFE